MLRRLWIFILIKATFFIKRNEGSVVHDLNPIPGLPDTKFVAYGNFNLGIILPIHHHNLQNFCGDQVRDLGLLQQIEAIDYTISEINREELLEGFSLGFIMYDDCHKDITGLAQSLHFINSNSVDSCFQDLEQVCVNKTMETYEVMGILGSETSVITIQMANLFTSFRLPQISYSATGQVLSDKTKYPFFQRVIPADLEMAKAIVAMLLHFNWTFVSVIYSENSYGTSGLKVFEEVAEDYGVCFAVVHTITADFQMGDYNRVVYDIMTYHARVAVVWSTLQEAQDLLIAYERLNSEGRIMWIASEAWARNLNELGTSAPYSLGSLSINIAAEEVDRFDEHFQLINPNTDTGNPWLAEFWESYFNCTNDSSHLHKFKMCESNLHFDTHPTYAPDNMVPLVFDSIYAYAHALRNALKSEPCRHGPKHWRKKCALKYLMPFLRNVTFQGEDKMVSFDNSGNVERDYKIYNVQNRTGHLELVQVGWWNSTADVLEMRPEWLIQWPRDKPVSVCSSPCGIGEEHVLLQQRCCWVCESCLDNQYTKAWDSDPTKNKCHTCPQRTWPDPETRTRCEDIEPTYLSWRDGTGIVLCALAVIGIAACLVTGALYILNNNAPLIKACSRELSYLLLIGLTFSYIFIFVFVIRPTTQVCLVRLVGLGLCFTFMYGPLFTKTLRIYRIFEAGKNMNRKPACVSSKSQIGIALNILLVHLCMILGWTIADGPTSVEVQPAANKVELICYFPLAPLIASLVFNGLLLIACTFCAFKTRKLPDNYNESKFICFCVFGTVVLWMAFIPSYFVVGDANYESLFLCLAVLTNATILLLSIFIPKIYAIYFVEKEELQVFKPSYSMFHNQGRTRRFMVEPENTSVMSYINSVDTGLPRQGSTDTLPDLPVTKDSKVDIFTAQGKLGSITQIHVAPSASGELTTTVATGITTSSVA